MKNVKVDSILPEELIDPISNSNKTIDLELTRAQSLRSVAANHLLVQATQNKSNTSVKLQSDGYGFKGALYFGSKK